MRHRCWGSEEAKTLGLGLAATAGTDEGSVHIPLGVAPSDELTGPRALRWVGRPCSQCLLAAMGITQQVQN